MSTPHEFSEWLPSLIETEVECKKVALTPKIPPQKSMVAYTLSLIATLGGTLGFFWATRFEPVIASVAYAVGILAFQVYVLALCRSPEAILHHSQWSTEEAHTIQIYRVFLRHPRSAPIASGLIALLALLFGFVWTPWLLWNSLWYQAAAVIGILAVSFVRHDRLDPITGFFAAKESYSVQKIVGPPLPWEGHPSFLKKEIQIRTLGRVLQRLGRD